MPIEVDAAGRLSEIASATVAVARERGARQVTLRAVAEQLGHSTAFITNFVPSRTHLMVNALEHAQSHWRDERESWLEGASGLDRLVVLTRWMCASTEEDEVLRGLWIEVIADMRNEDRTAYDVVRAVTDSTYDAFESSAVASGIDDPEAIADILYLYCRGYHVKSVEDPTAWTDERIARSIGTLIEALLGASVALDEVSR